VVVEIFNFRLAPDASSEAFLAADARVQTEFYYVQPGIVRRTTARSGDDWCVVVFWAKVDDALAASHAAADDAAAQAFGALLEHGSLRVERYETLD
jgi:hypothetical protein